jgi:hypothetical protein
MRSLWAMLAAKGKEECEPLKKGFHAVCSVLLSSASQRQAREMLHRPVPNISLQSFGLSKKNEASVPVAIAAMLCRAVQSDGTALTLDPIEAALCLLFAQHKGVLLCTQTQPPEDVYGLLPFCALCTPVRMVEAANCEFRLVEVPLPNNLNSTFVFRCETLRDVRAGDEIRVHFPRSCGVLDVARDREMATDDVKRSLFASSGSHAVSTASSLAQKMARLVTSPGKIPDDLFPSR